MRRMSAAFSLVIAIGLLCCQSAGAVPASATAMKEPTTAALPLRQIQYREHRTRHGFVKCYREFVVGRYRCHYYRYYHFRRRWW